MFSLEDRMLPVSLLRAPDPTKAVADHFGVRIGAWGEAKYAVGNKHLVRHLASIIASRLADADDLKFVKLDVVWVSAESAERVAAFKKRIGLGVRDLLRRPLVADGVRVEDWASLFEFALLFGWDAAAISRRKRALLWLSHDEFVRATPKKILRGL